MDTYRIVRFFRDDKPSKVMVAGLTLGEAQAWCQDPETSSLTAVNQPYPQTYGEWFDGYEAE